MSIHEFPTLSAQRYGSRLKAMREDQGLTRDELAQKAGVTRRNVQMLEYGHRIDMEIRAKIVMCLEESGE